MKNIILLAAPAAGKGTQSKLICDKYNLIHISTGDLLRESLNSDTEISKIIKREMDAGNLVSDEIIINLIENRLKMEDVQNGFILDGFPRNLNQAIELDKLLKNLNMNISNVIYLKIEKELAKKRIIGRLSCTNCKSVYNDQFEELAPKKVNICDKCGSELSHRSDDNEKTFEKRFNTYITETKPLIEYYNNHNLLSNIDSTNDVNIIFNQIEKIIDGEI